MDETKSVARNNMKNPLFLNWLATVFMLNVAHVELKEFTFKIMRNFFNKITANNAKNRMCSTCSFVQAKSCTRPGKCTVKDIVRDMTLAHTKQHLCVNNTDITTCLTDYWTLAQCYMSETSRAKTPKDADFSCLVNVVINNTSFMEHLEEIGENIEVFVKARDVRNITMHSSSMEITRSTLNYNKNVLSNMLRAIESKTSHESIEKIQQLDLNYLSKRDVVNAFEENLEALTRFQSELEITIPKIEEDLYLVKQELSEASNRTEKTITNLRITRKQLTRIKTTVRKGKKRDIGKSKRKLASKVLSKRRM